MGIRFPVLTNPSIYKIPHLRDFAFMHSYFIIYKPYLVLSQFTSQGAKQTLADYFTVPKDVYPVGRLDEDSEGLLILTNDKLLNHRLLNPSFAHEREYWVQVDGAITTEALLQIQNGAEITVNGQSYTTKKCSAALMLDSPRVPQREPPIRFRKEIPAPWIKLVLTEGKNRQVRKMTAKTGFPTLRLIRSRIEKLTLNNLQPGEIISLPQKTIFKKLFGETHF
ncbi:MAG TPA: pseudouridine synthase [Chitinophagaceae bacterium]|nr:pseudouridine synthase [Chitinophagaceae bacterium]